MPAVSSDLKDLMCYQLNKFERTTTIPQSSSIESTQITPSLTPSNTRPTSLIPEETSVVENILYQNLTSCHHHHHQNNYQNIFNCDCCGDSGNVSSSIKAHHPFHYCPEYESQVKRSRTIRFSSGGDVIIDKTHGYANTSWLVSSNGSSGSLVQPPPTPLRQKSQTQPTTLMTEPRRNSSINSNSNSNSQVLNNRFTTATISNNENEGSSNLTISLNLPAPFDLDYFLKTHCLNISINVSEKKTTGIIERSATMDRSTIDTLNRNLLVKSGWYYRNVDWQESKRILKTSPLGTFILRDSGDPRYSFSLSVQTTKGPISSRISYNNGKYRLDSQAIDAEKMPAFTTIIALIDHYMKNGLVRSASGRQVWIDSLGQVCSPVQLTKPKLKEQGSLKHLARLVLNMNPSLLNSIQIPTPIKSYLEDYPYTF